MTATRSDNERIRALRAAQIDGAGPPAALRSRLSDFYDGLVAELAGELEGSAAIVAVGSLGRREVMPYGDIDLVLVTDGRVDQAGVADRVWYPLWDAGIGLDHSVRTVDEAIRLAGEDVAVALGLVDARWLAGDRDLAADLVAHSREAWRRDGASNAAKLAEAATDRAEHFGELAFLTEPDLKQAKGGLRDGHALRGLAVAQLADPMAADVKAAYELLLDVRTLLHTTVGRSLDRLVQQQQGPIAVALGYADADDLLRAVSGAGRTISYAWDSASRRVPTKPNRSVWQRRTPARRPLADGVVAHGSEVVLARDADRSDPSLLLRFAAAAAIAELPMSPYALDSLTSTAADMPVPWPRPARDALVTLLGAGRSTVPVIEGLDRSGALEALSPSGRTSAAARNATRCTASPSTGTWSRRRSTPSTSCVRSAGRTCCSSPRCCTTSARAAAATTASPGPNWRPASPPGSACPRTMRRSSSRWSGTTCCSPTPPPAAISTIPRPWTWWPERSADSVRPARHPGGPRDGRRSSPPARRPGATGSTA